jgi:purine-binding chemotaxis protein CheW
MSVRLFQSEEESMRTGVLDRLLTAPRSVSAAPRRFLTFTIGGQAFGVEALVSRDIITLPTPHSLPGAPRYIRGRCTLGRINLPVVDLRALFALASTGRPLRTEIVLVASRTHSVGIVADTIAGVYTTRLDPPRPSSLAVLPDPRYVQGDFEAAGRIVIALDIDRILIDLAPAIEAASRPHG